jgi:hypothetical protein
MNNPDRNKDTDFKASYVWAEFLCGQFAKTAIVFLRHDFGERYFNVVDSFGASATFIGYAFVASIILAEKDDGFVLALFLLCFVAMSGLHLILANRRSRSGRRWHSRYPGTSFLEFLAPGNVFFVQRWIEPFLTIFTGIAIGIINRPLGVWLVFSGICIAATEQMRAQRFRNRLLDMIDSQIETEQLSAAVFEQKQPKETEGFVLPIPKYYTPEQRRAVYVGMSQLDPALQAMMDESTVTTGRREPQIT